MIAVAGPVVDLEVFDLEAFDLGGFDLGAGVVG